MWSGRLPWRRPSGHVIVSSRPTRSGPGGSRCGSLVATPWFPGTVRLLENHAMRPMRAEPYKRFRDDRMKSYRVSRSCLPRDRRARPSRLRRWSSESSPTPRFVHTSRAAMLSERRAPTVFRLEDASSSRGFEGAISASWGCRFGKPSKCSSCRYRTVSVPGTLYSGEKEAARCFDKIQWAADLRRKSPSEENSSGRRVRLRLQVKVARGLWARFRGLNRLERLTLFV